MSKQVKRNFRPKVYIVGGGFEYIRLMYQLGNEGAKTLDEADIVLFTGGEDVDPQLYGEVALSRTNFNTNRDSKEMLIYKTAVERGIPMVGICRGAQFLNVMNGGKMWQHVTNHTGNHLAYIQVGPFLGKGKNKKPRVITVTSTHHQMMRPTPSAMVLLTAKEALEKHSHGLTDMGKHPSRPDIEAVFYDETNCLCFQPHPEFKEAPADCVAFFTECMDNFVYPKIVLDPTTKSIINQIPPSVNSTKEK